MSVARILAYSHDGFGLGHLRRNLNIATGLLAGTEETSVLLVAGVPGIPGLDLPDGADLLKLPSLRKVGTDSWRPRTLRVDRERLARMRRALIDAAVQSFEPDVLLVDYMPGGVWGELVPTLERLHASGRARIVLGLRDILDAPAVTRRSWAESGHADALRRYYDNVLVYGDKELFDTSAAHGLEDLAPGRVEHVGYVCTSPTDVGREEARRRLEVEPDEKLVLVTGGGGCDAYPMMDLALRGLSLVPVQRRLRSVVITGPLMDLDEVSRLESRAKAAGATVRRTSQEMGLLMSAADLIVTMAAYNTLTEAVGLGLPILSMPREGPSAEQGMRADLFERRGLLRRVPSGASPGELAAMVATALSEPSRPRHLPALDGLANTVQRLLGLGREATKVRDLREQAGDVLTHPSSGTRAPADKAQARSRANHG